MRYLNFMKSVCFALVLFIGSCLLTTNIYADTPIRIIHYGNEYGNFFIPIGKIDDMIKANFKIDGYDKVNVQVLLKKGKPNYVIAYLFPKNNHYVEIARINISKDYDVLSVKKNYVLKKEDVPLSKTDSELYTCPDDTIQFIAFAPNNIDIEQTITKEVADYAELKGLKTIRLLIEDATRANFLNYASCPKLEGIFYDGDANPYLITAYDGTTISAEDIAKLNFSLQTTNYWLACEGYLDPLKSAVINSAQTQKYAAGLNLLKVGPSDMAAACAMKQALDKQELSTSFQTCYKEYDIPNDKWGFGGNGSDWFTWTRQR